MTFFRCKSAKMKTREVKLFHASYNDRGNSDTKKAFLSCRARNYCPFLRQGKLYICAKPALVHYFNKRYGTMIPNSGFVDIYKSKLTGWDVLDALNKPANTCAYCFYEFNNFDWAVSTQQISDWRPEKYKKYLNLITH